MVAVVVVVRWLVEWSWLWSWSSCGVSRGCGRRRGCCVGGCGCLHGCGFTVLRLDGFYGFTVSRCLVVIIMGRVAVAVEFWFGDLPARRGDEACMEELLPVERAPR